MFNDAFLKRGPRSGSEISEKSPAAAAASISSSNLSALPDSDSSLLPPQDAEGHASDSAAQAQVRRGLLQTQSDVATDTVRRGAGCEGCDRYKRSRTRNSGRLRIAATEEALDIQGARFGASP